MLVDPSMQSTACTLPHSPPLTFVTSLRSTVADNKPSRSPPHDQPCCPDCLQAAGYCSALDDGVRRTLTRSAPDLLFTVSSSSLSGTHQTSTDPQDCVGGGYRGQTTLDEFLLGEVDYDVDDFRDDGEDVTVGLVTTSGLNANSVDRHSRMVNTPV